MHVLVRAGAYAHAVSTPVPTAGPTPSGPSPTWPLHVVVVLVLLEAAALVLVGVWGVTRIGDGGSGSVGIFLVLFTLGVAAMLVGATRALRCGRRIGRAPVAAWQLLQAATSVAVIQAGVGVAWIPLVVALVVVVLLMTRPVVERTIGR